MHSFIINIDNQVIFMVSTKKINSIWCYHGNFKYLFITKNIDININVVCMSYL